MLQRKTLLLLISLGLLVTAGIAYAATVARTPQGFDKTLVYIMAGRYNSTIPPAEGDLTTWFHETIMNRTEAEILAEKNAAWDYFKATFGENIPEPFAFGVDPRNEYRVYYISGEDVPSEGWVVRDGGFRSDVLPGGMYLNGTWGDPDGDGNGTWVPEGSFIVFGDYNIDAQGPGESGNRSVFAEPIIIHYESAEPILPDPINNVVAFRCTLSGPWGEGIAQGISKLIDEGDGVVQANTRNILTFPPFGPSIDHTTTP